jgi:hypothetical protein
MTQKEFDYYKFGIKTQVKCGGRWHKVLGVDFETREISINGMWRLYDEIEDTKEIL